MSSSPDRSPSSPQSPVSDSNPSNNEPSATAPGSPEDAEMHRSTSASSQESSQESLADSKESEPPLVPKRPLMRPVSRPQPPSPPPVSAVAKPAPAALPAKPAEPPAAKASVEAAQTDPGILRHQPIPPPSEPKQYRAIGLVRGRYSPSEEQFTRGSMTVADGTQVEAVLLGRVMSLVKNHLDLEQEHLWVVYPRTRDAQQDLHLQIVGVWEPEKLSRPDSDEENSESAAIEDYSPGVDDDYFSIRGEVVFCAPENQSVVVKIQQTPRKTSDKAKAFKLQLNGVLESEKTVGYFWDLHVQRKENILLITRGNLVGLVPPRKKDKDHAPGRGDRRPFRPGGGRGGARPPASGATPAPRREALPKPAKRSSSDSQPPAS